MKSNPRQNQVKDFTGLESEYLESIEGRRSLVGYLCMRTPVELIEAYGAVPIRIVSSQVAVSSGFNPIRNDACSFCKQVPELMKLDSYKYLSGIIAGSCCDQMRRTVDVLNETLDIPAIIYSAPRTYGQNASFFLNEMKAAFAKLADSLRLTIDENELHKAIKSRKQLRKLVNQKRYDGAISAPLIHKLAGSCLPAEKIIEFLTGLKPLPVNSDSVRLMLFGSIPSGKEILLIEEVGGYVAVDLTCLGDRVFEIKQNLPEEPFEFLYKHYIEHNNCPHRRSYAPLIDYAKQQIKRGAIDGIVYRSVKYCHPFGLAAKRFKEELGMPFLELDDDLTLQATGSFRTRLGAFVEMLEAQKRRKVAQV